MTKNNAKHIAILGRCNVGKSSIINLLLEQDFAIVSEQAGTTTDPVNKIIEFTGIGPTVLIDTAGINDTTEISQLRINKTMQVLNKIDLAIIVFSNNVWGNDEENLIIQLNKKEVPYLIMHNKSDIIEFNKKLSCINKINTEIIDISCYHKANRQILISHIINKLKEKDTQIPSLLGDIVNYGEHVLLVVPIDIEAPHGRLILPQVNVIRDLLDQDALVSICKEREIDLFLKNFIKAPKLVITDSQVFLKVAASIPSDILLTSFSIILAKAKSDFNLLINGTRKINYLKNHDNILMLESCNHHASGDDIGRVKIPRWLQNYTGLSLNFTHISSFDVINDIHKYSLVIQCGGCMFTKTQLHQRLKPFIDNNIPCSNYGLTIAWCLGIFERAIMPFIKINNLDL